MNVRSIQYFHYPCKSTQSTLKRTKKVGNGSVLQTRNSFKNGSHSVSKTSIKNLYSASLDPVHLCKFTHDRAYSIMYICTYLGMCLFQKVYQIPHLKNEGHYSIQSKSLSVHLQMHHDPCMLDTDRLSYLEMDLLK